MMLPSILSLPSPLKGSVQRNLRGMVSCYIPNIQKLSLRPIIAGHTILILLKGHFTIYKIQLSESKAGLCYIYCVGNVIIGGCLFCPHNVADTIFCMTALYHNMDSLAVISIPRGVILGYFWV